MQLIEMAGKRFGRLLVVHRADNLIQENGRQRSMWLCKCDCGKRKIVGGDPLRSGNTISCGCVAVERITNLRKTHGRSKSKEYKAWLHIKQRCYNPNCAKYHIYGARGIKVCQRWLDSFDSFLLDMGTAPSRKHTIDRVDVNGNYEPHNCRWATNTVQSNNRRDNVFIEHEGRRLTLKQWAQQLGINYKSLWHQFRKKNLVTIPQIIQWQKSNS